MQANTVALGCSPKLEDKTTWLKTAYTLDTGLDRINQEAPLREPSFIVFGGSMEASKGAKQSLVLSICKAREPQKTTSQERQTQEGNKLNTSLR